MVSRVISFVELLNWLHDDVMKWNITALLALCVGNSPVTGESPPHHPLKRPVTRSVDVSIDLRLSKQLSK